jgi:hypothetical protein
MQLGAQTAPTASTALSSRAVSNGAARCAAAFALRRLAGLRACQKRLVAAELVLGGGVKRSGVGVSRLGGAPAGEPSAVAADGVGVIGTLCQMLVEG